VTTNTLYLCHDPARPHWQLGTAPRANRAMTLIGWKAQPAAIDAGVPDPVAALLAAALVSVGRVGYFSRTGNSDCKTSQGDSLQVLDPGNFATRLISKLRGFPSDAMLCASRNAETVKQLFETDGFSWTMQGQTALLLAPDAAPPQLTFQSAQRLLGDGWSEEVVGFGRHGLIAALRPGVDGDVAAYLPLNDDARAAFLNALRIECASRGFMLENCDEETFSARLAAKSAVGP
jgi:hypothetical protein